MPRTETIEKTVYTFAELSDAAKEKARDWWRTEESQDWHGAESVIEDAECVAEILGIEFDTRTVKRMGGGTRKDSLVYWSGFSSQGDGACFAGWYAYAKGSARKIREYAPQDETLHAIADALASLQRRAFYGLTTRMQHRGRYYHSGCMAVDVEYCRALPEDLESGIADQMRAFADWIYRQLEKEYEYTMSDESVDESIACNGYEFDESGRIH